MLHHVPLEGNGLKALTKMDIPGLDVLTSDPEAVIHSGWLTAGLPASAARAQRRPARDDRGERLQPEDGRRRPGGTAGDAGHRRLAGRLGRDRVHALLRPGRSLGRDVSGVWRLRGPAECHPQSGAADADVLLYYPIYDLWAEYLPVGRAAAAGIAVATGPADRVVLHATGPDAPAAPDPVHADRPRVPGDGQGAAGRHAGDPRPPVPALVLPDGCELPAAAAQTAEQFRTARRPDPGRRTRTPREPARTAAGRLPTRPALGPADAGAVFARRLPRSCWWSTSAARPTAGRWAARPQAAGRFWTRRPARSARARPTKRGVCRYPSRPGRRCCGCALAVEVRSEANGRASAHRWPVLRRTVGRQPTGDCAPPGRICGKPVGLRRTVRHGRGGPAPPPHAARRSALAPGTSRGPSSGRVSLTCAIPGAGRRRGSPVPGSHCPRPRGDRFR